MENSSHLFDKLKIWLKLNQSGVHASFARPELYLGTENQS